MKRFIRELRRREVFRTLGLYVGVCWILIEVASVVLPTGTLEGAIEDGRQGRELASTLLMCGIVIFILQSLLAKAREAGDAEALAVCQRGIGLALMLSSCRPNSDGPSYPQ